jgi:hypothetical protein
MKYESFLNPVSADISQNVSFSAGGMDRSMGDYTTLTPIPHRNYEMSSAAKSEAKNMIRGHGPYPNPNYALIVRDLGELQDEIKLIALIQALRWRLTRSQNLVRKEVMN